MNFHLYKLILDNRLVFVKEILLVDFNFIIFVENCSSLLN